MSLVSPSYTAVDGTQIDASDINGPLQTLVNDYNGNITDANLSSLAAIALSKLAQPAWTAYTPTWAGATTSPAILNGVLQGYYQQIGKTVFFRINLTPGSTTTYGSGNYTLSLPTTASANIALKTLIGMGNLEDNGVTAYAPLGLRFASTTTFDLIYSVGSGGANTVGVWAPTTPFTFGSGDFLRLSGQYEAA